MKSINNKIIVCCTQSANRLFTELKNYKLKNIFIWFDEAHWCIENWINKKDKKYKKYWLESNNIKYRLFTSASPNETIVKSNFFIQS